MQSAVVSFPKSSNLNANLGQVEARPSGFFDAPPVLPASSLAAAVALALHRGLVSESEREHLPLRVSG
ncbi:MAG: hypothetical protein QM784_20045 [Polyangiaceae bacterium]